ncbi:DUF305 domain-containing protein [Palleronia sp.]|uniref:CopM family metallochaperone n=1 Tax=Palleronia sp. TaxID=1940284 RepID=UPI0035C7E335
MIFYNTGAIVGLVTLMGAATLAGSAVAQDTAHGGNTHGMDHGQMMMEDMSHGGATPPDQAQGHDSHDEAAGSPATKAFRAANLAMHEAMDIEFTDNADIDFARGMIGHHQGAIDMARVALEHGEDPQLRQLAEEVIATQEEEITFLRQWIADNAE